MAEKTLQTRIKLRYASYSEWQSSTLKLLAGEVALCYVPANNDEIKNTAPTVLFKVGNGSKVFSELQWASARAADVYNWAKQSTLPIEKLGSGNVVASISWDAENNKLKYETVSVATSEGLEELQNLVAGINTRLGAAETDIDNLQAAIETLNGENTVDGSVAKAVKTAIDAEVIARDDAIKVETDRAKKAEGALSDRIDDYETNKETFALKSDVTGLSSTVSGIDGRLTTAEGKITTAEENITTIQGNITDINSSLSNKLDKGAYDKAISDLQGEVDAVEDRATAVEGKVNTLVGEDSDKSVREITQAEIAAQLAGGGTSFDTLQEIAAWLKDHPEDVGEMNEKINASTDAIALLNNAETVEGSVAYAVKQEADRAKGVENGLSSRIKTIEDDYLVAQDKADLEKSISDETSRAEGIESGLNTRLQTVEGYFDNGVAKNAKDADTLDGKDADYFAVKSEVNRAVSGLDNRVKAIEDDYLVEADKTELEGKITAEVSAREAAVKGVADRVKTLEDANLDNRVKAIEDDYLKAADTYIFDCGSCQ